jgi:hypothetical protein
MPRVALQNFSRSFSLMQCVSHSIKPENPKQQNWLVANTARGSGLRFVKQQFLLYIIIIIIIKLIIRVIQVKIEINE